MNEMVTHVAALLRERNIIDSGIAKIIGRPVTAGHLGEWIASQIFDISLEESAATPGLDGRFRTGPVSGRTVNIKWYMKRTGLLDTTESSALDYYLVLTGPPSPPDLRVALPGRGALRQCSCSMLVSCAPRRPIGGQARHRLQRDRTAVERGRGVSAGP